MRPSRPVRAASAQPLTPPAALSRVGDAGREALLQAHGLDSALQVPPEGFRPIREYHVAVSRITLNKEGFQPL